MNKQSKPIIGTIHVRHLFYKNKLYKGSKKPAYLPKTILSKPKAPKTPGLNPYKPG